MRAAILETINAPLVLGDVELGELGEGHVLVKILVSGICGAQLQEIAGNKGNAGFVPHLLGHEGCGIVEAVGPGVQTVSVGDKVVLHWRKGEGIEADFPRYRYKNAEMTSGKVTTFSEYTIVSENLVTTVPHETPTDLAALLGCGLSTALGTIENEACVTPNDSVMVVGCGGLGAGMILAARIMGAKHIIAVDIHDSKESAVRALGATSFINSATADVAACLQDILGRTSVDVIIETTGNAQSITKSLTYLGPSGRFILVGQPRPGDSVEILDAHHLFGGEGKTIKATQGGKFNPARDIPRYLDLYHSGTLSIDNLVTHRIALEEINDAIELMRSGKAHRILIDICKQ